MIVAGIIAFVAVAWVTHYFTIARFTKLTPLLFALEAGGPGSWSRAPVVKPLLAAGADPCPADSHRGPALLRGGKPRPRSRACAVGARP